MVRKNVKWGLSAQFSVSDEAQKLAGTYLLNHDVWHTQKKALTWFPLFQFSPPLTTNPFCYWKWEPISPPPLWQTESQKCHISSPWTFFCKQNHSPSISTSSSSSPPSREHNWLRIKLMFLRGHPFPRLTAHVKPANPICPLPPPVLITLTAIISPVKSYNPNLPLQAKSITGRLLPIADVTQLFAQRAVVG